ncbi:MAG: helix-turn-helix domain-containing protein [Rhizobiales bacterium]|nr:helix-turn-helix domain-containing protein [Hyphomicrobiales bacterium]
MPSKRAKPRGRPAQREASTGPAVRGLDNALALLEVIADGDGLQLTDAAQRAGIAASTAHRILTTLATHNFVRHDEERDHWLIGVAAFEIGSAFLRNRKVLEVGRPLMHELMELSGETVNLAIRDGDEIIYVAQVETHSPIRAFQRAGSRAPLHASAIGKVLLADLPEAAVRATLHRTGLERFTPKTIVSPEAFAAALTAARVTGYAVDDEERVPGLRCIASAVFDEHGEPLAGLSLSGPLSRLTDERMAELAPQVRRAARTLSERIGGRMPTSRSE